jgi:hypothetical protein
LGGERQGDLERAAGVDAGAVLQDGIVGEQPADVGAGEQLGAVADGVTEHRARRALADHQDAGGIGRRGVATENQRAAAELDLRAGNDGVAAKIRDGVCAGAGRAVARGARRLSAARAPEAVRMARLVRKTHATDRHRAQMKNIAKLTALCLVLVRVRMVSGDRKLCLGLEGRRRCRGRSRGGTRENFL